MKKKNLLIQIRQTELVKKQELECFSEFSGIALDEFEVFDVFSDKSLANLNPNDYRSIFVGGASEASVLKPDEYPFVPQALIFLQKCIDAEVPVFASCFGFQLAVLTLGGEIISDTTDFEMGTIPIRLTPDASEDLVFRGIPNDFRAVSVHKEKAIMCPDWCTILAYTESCIHAFKVTGKPFWAFQFHPEVSKQILIQRLTYYKDKYVDDHGQLQSVIDSAVETPYSHQLLNNFYNNVLIK